MKKLVLLSAFVLGCFTMTASVTPEESNDVMEIVLQDDFTEIAVDSVPQAIKDALASDYAGATIDKAYVSENKVFKLDVTLNGTSSVLYANEGGEWITE